MFRLACLSLSVLFSVCFLFRKKQERCELNFYFFSCWGRFPVRIAARTNELTCDSQRCLCWIIDDLKHRVISNKSIKLFISIQTSLTQNAKELKATLTWNKRVWSRNQLDKVSSGNCLPPFDLQQWTFESVRLSLKSISTKGTHQTLFYSLDKWVISVKYSLGCFTQSSNCHCVTNIIPVLSIANANWKCFVLRTKDYCV